jgi:hypothetical protein
MKRLVTCLVGGALLCGGPLRAAPNYELVGAAAGVAGGLILANNVDGVSRIWAVPVGALVGSLAGHEFRSWARHSEYPVYSLYAVQPAPAPDRDAQRLWIPDPHPGVDLIKVSVVNANGVCTEVPILRVADRFIGPQGESYTNLPTAAELARKYGLR